MAGRDQRTESGRSTLDRFMLSQAIHALASQPGNTVVGRHFFRAPFCHPRAQAYPCTCDLRMWSRDSILSVLEPRRLAPLCARMRAVPGDERARLDESLCVAERVRSGDGLGCGAHGMAGREPRAEFRRSTSHRSLPSQAVRILPTQARRRVGGGEAGFLRVFKKNFARSNYAFRVEEAFLVRLLNLNTGGAIFVYAVCVLFCSGVSAGEAFVVQLCARQRTTRVRICGHNRVVALFSRLRGR